MAEILRDTQVTMTLDVAGATDVFYTVRREGVVILEGTGSSFPLPFKIYGYNGTFDVAWEFTVLPDTTIHTRYESHEIVTRYVDNLSDPAMITRERAVRRSIQAYCGQDFGYYYGSIAVQGNGTNVLRLPKRLINVDNVGFTVAPFTPIPIGYVNIVNDGWGLSTAWGNDYYGIKEAPPDDGIYMSTGVIYVPGTRRLWSEAYTYGITGSWGYESVPLDVLEAASYLMDDRSFPEDQWRNRYVDNIRAGDWRLEFTGMAHRGTGNVEADRLLDKYRLSGVGVI